MTQEQTVKPTAKQLFLARRLGISGGELMTRKELALLIKEKLKEKQELKEKEKKQEVGEEVENLYVLEEYPGHTNVKSKIVITIPKKANAKTFSLLKKKRLYSHSPSLMSQLIEFLVRVGAKNKGDHIEIITDEDGKIYSPSYVISTLESFYLSFSWRYAE